MASKERIQRLKEETRINILEASLDIAKREGWSAVSMRKIADAIEYTAPIIYEYFASKDALLLEITRRGFLILSSDIGDACSLYKEPAEQLESMWFAYWNFAFKNKEFYQLMFGVEMNTCCDLSEALPESKNPFNLFSEVIVELMPAENPLQETICLKYYTFWSIVHGLVSINILKRGHSEELNNRILKDAICAIIESIKKS